MIKVFASSCKVNVMAKRRIRTVADPTRRFIKACLIMYAPLPHTNAFDLSPLTEQRTALSWFYFVNYIKQNKFSYISIQYYKKIRKNSFFRMDLVFKNP